MTDRKEYLRNYYHRRKKTDGTWLQYRRDQSARNYKRRKAQKDRETWTQFFDNYAPCLTDSERDSVVEQVAQTYRLVRRPQDQQ